LELGLSDAEIARRTGLSERRYGHYVTGEREPDLVTLTRISTTLGLTPNDLLLDDAETAAAPERTLLEERYRVALGALEMDDLHLALCQLECLVKARGKRKK
jgi:transcriptional regulator with XRE-family HTH domain